ncbi:glycosyltransferase family 61 protein [uncultured Sulfitobacter sp.]|uniref:glycosyltransferase 61 family protein n=1 Tax=uncultured Sulfitobacter sp. TaxID=191468 RepID=UPI0026189B4C|nr:glycosyltransferase family 61 protein [uncultured Sulfitobacter sp.]
MRNKIDLSADPEALFLNPWQDEGLKLLRRPKFFWRTIPPATIVGFAVSAHPEINEKIRSFVRSVDRHKRFKSAVEINAVPAVIERASFRKSHAMAGDKLVLSGASATRLFNSFRLENDSEERPSIEALNAYLKKCRSGNEGRKIGEEKTFLESDLDFAIECRNTFNYYHFITESLSHLCVLDDVGFQGNIYFHFPNQEEKHREFADAFVAALFPEFLGRVFFERTPKDYDLVLTAYNFIGGMCQMPQTDLEKLADIAPEGHIFGSIDFLPVLAMNAVSTPLLALRERALKAIEGRDFGYLPKRFFIGRGSAQSRPRPLAGQDLLLEHLQRFGFEYVVFEDLEPLEQVALMAQAEMMISNHGAGFTNMLFANPDAFVIELGTLQTAKTRWADFWPLAHASQCRYLNFFADFNNDDTLAEPQFKTEGIVPTAVSDFGAAQVVSFIVTVLGQIPTMPDPKSLHVLGDRVLKAGAAARALALLAQHEKMVTADLDLCILCADCHKALDQPKSELIALEQAFKADPARWQTLIRIIWCANRCERAQVIRWALSRLAADFPERHDAFVANHDWLRFVA